MLLCFALNVCRLCLVQAAVPGTDPYNVIFYNQLKAAYVVAASDTAFGRAFRQAIHRYQQYMNRQGDVQTNIATANAPNSTADPLCLLVSKKTLRNSFSNLDLLPPHPVHTFWVKGE